MLRVNERVFRRCLTDIHFKGAARSLGIDPFAAVLADHDALPSRFRETRYPQMLTQLDTARDRTTQRALSVRGGDDFPAHREDRRASEAIEQYGRTTREPFAPEHDLDIDR